MRTDSSRPWHGWRHPMFWKMLGADFLLVGLAALVYPVGTGTRLVLVLLALLVTSVVLNAALMPPARELPLHEGLMAHRVYGAADSTSQDPAATPPS